MCYVVRRDIPRQRLMFQRGLHCGRQPLLLFHIDRVFCVRIRGQERRDLERLWIEMMFHLMS